MIAASAASRVAVVGLGYIGLPTAACLATGGLHVIGVDINAEIVERVNCGEAPFAEPDLSIAVSGAVAMGRLCAQTEMPTADAYIIAVPTPFTADHQSDLTSVFAAAEAIAARLRGGEIIVLESTCPPGTTRRISELIAQRRPDLSLPHVPDAAPDVLVAHCPERVLPGRIMIEIAANDRVIGGVTPTCAARAAELYRTFCHGELIITDADSAEMAKLAENAYRDVNIAFANELSLICDQLGLDIWAIRRMANRHPRVEILRPGPGVGGHCIAVDPWFIVESAPDLAPLIRAARAVNGQMPVHVAERIVATSRRFRDPRIACLGLSFKADVGDLRESPAVEIVHRVAAALPDVKVLAVEPHAQELPGSLGELGNVLLTGTEDAIGEADVIALLVDHSRFRAIRKTHLAGKVVYDTRGMWE
ncbi:MAG TPA: UDP-N-acetyl-D-mannosamine dehydrogenase [Streptosporangiaceae bacterium]|nr:UDP-N-acetyl-D-mannosamine dehydrogenase [Streptosporangiaceae bacterium]